VTSRRRVTVGRLWGRTVRLADLAPLHSAIWLIGLTALCVAADLTWREEALSGLLNLIAACSVTVGQYSITRALVLKAYPGERRLAGFGTFFILAIVTGLAVWVGLAALVVPGIFLMIRWWACAPALLAQDLRVGEAIRTSWRQTGGHEWPILLLLLSIWIPALILLGLALDPVEPSLPGSLITNLAINGALIAGWHAAVAIHLSTNFSSGVEEVFA
jgi:hypothetical protein